MCTAAVGFCCRTAPLPPLPPPPPVEPLNPGKGSSKFFGVGWHKRNQKWRASIKHNGRQVELGANFDTEIAAAKAVDVWLRNNGRAAEANFDESGSYVPRVATKSSKYRGVSWDKIYSQWRASIKVAGEMVNLGYFDDEQEAARTTFARGSTATRRTSTRAASRSTTGRMPSCRLRLRRLQRRTRR